MNRLWMLGIVLVAGCPSSPGSNGPTTIQPTEAAAPWTCFTRDRGFGATSSSCYRTAERCEEAHAFFAKTIDWPLSDCVGAENAYCYTYDMLNDDGSVSLDDTDNCTIGADECQSGRRMSTEAEDAGDVTACVDMASGVALTTVSTWACYAGQHSIGGPFSDCQPSLAECNEQLESRPPTEFTPCEEVEQVHCFSRDTLGPEGQVISDDFVSCYYYAAECEENRGYYLDDPGYADVRACTALP